MHPKFWKFPGAAYRDQATGDEGGKSAGGGGAAEPTEAEKAAAADAAAAKVAADAGKPTDAEAKLLKEVMQKKEALKVAEADAAAAKARLAEFDGVDPAEIKKLLSERKTAEEAALAAKGDFETLKTRMAEEHTKVTTALQDQVNALTQQLAAKDRIVDELSVGTQFSQSAFIKDETTIPPAKARALYGAHFDLEDGKVVGYDKPRGAAGRAPLVDQLGNNVAFEDAMRKIIEADPDKDSLLRSKVKPGAGSTSAAPGKVVTPPAANLNTTSKIAAGLQSLNLLGSVNQVA
ncbi:DUF6651 domain-containing protein [Massilia sp. TN1-12]|uniref:DUF6651 domain-containing protein n=1 Tax=Massilia paldalensis TaxID=3377675 RepID=UPI00384B1EB6